MNTSGENSPHVADLVDDYLHELLSESQARQVKEHCGVCPPCEAALQAARTRYAALHALAPVEASRELVEKTMGKISRRQQRRQQVWWWSTRGVALATAASFLVLSGLTLYFYNLEPSPYDVRLLGQRELLAGSRAEMRVGVFNQLNGQPVANVPLTLQLRNPRANQLIQLASLQTGPDGAGVAALELPDWDPGKYEIRVEAAPGRGVESVSRWVQLRRDWKLMVTSDKPVYKPGQTIHVRALALRQPDLKPLKDQPVVFEVADPRGNVIFKQSVESSTFGIGHVDCPLANEIPEGDYQVRCRIGDVRSDLTVKVARYVLPKFQLRLTLDKPFYQPGQSIQATVQANYFFGQPVQGGKLELFVDGQRRDTIPIETDKTGQATTAFELPGTLAGVEQHSGAARVELVVQLTDAGGQKEAARAVALVSNAPIQLAVVPASGTLVMGVPNQIFVQATYPDGRPVDATIQIAGSEESLRTDSLGIASLELTPQQSGVALGFTATDSDGNVTRRRVELVAGGFSDDFLLLTDRSFYRGGETMTLSVRGSGVEPVFVDLIRDGQTVLTRTVEVNGGVGELDIDLPAELFGPLRVVAYRFGAAGVAVRKSRMILVRRSDDLRITAQLDADEYRPGEHAQLRLRVHDDQGRPVPGALSVAAVDEAVFSVLNQETGMERRFFQLENELLEPAYTVYGWKSLDEDDLTDEQRIRLEQALFAWTAHAARGSSVVPVRLASGGGQESGVGMKDRYWAPNSPRVESRESVPPPHTLAITSFQEKENRVARERRHGLRSMWLAWIAASAILVLALLAILAYFRPLIFVVISVIGLGVVCFGVLPLLLLSSKATGRWGGVGAESGVAEMMMPLPLEGEPGSAIGQGPPRLRQKFPETLIWKPQIITDDQGEAVLEIDLADSITTWRVTASAVSANGQLGGDRFPIRVFQPFFVDFDLPVALTRHDEVSVPVVVYNYLEKPQTVELEVKADDWFELLNSVADGEDASEQPPSRKRRIELQPGEVKAVHFPLKALRVGKHPIEVTATAGDVSDAVRREVEVVPNGRKSELVVSGLLDQPFEVALDVPQDIVPGSATAVVTLNPDHFSQLVEGLDAILRMPHGCFEQTSSTTYPNVLALDYLRKTGLQAPDVEIKARQYIHVGYQRLLTFEVSGGGFDWYGNPPASELLTAYGLMEFQDMAKVHDVDPRLIERTRRWLINRRQANGSWAVADRHLPNLADGGDPMLGATAYIAWAVFQSELADIDGGPTRDYLLSHPAESIDDAYTLALLINALALLRVSDQDLEPYVVRLDALKQVNESPEQVWWSPGEGRRTAFFGAGTAGDVEATAMAALALMQVDRHPGSVRGALNWLVSRQDERGTWHSTQATVLALKALLQGGDKSREQNARQLEVLFDGKLVKRFAVEPDQLGVVQHVELTDLSTGSHPLMIRDLSGQASGYHVLFRYYKDVPVAEPPNQPLTINILYERNQIEVDQRVPVLATVLNMTSEDMPMVILDLPIPPGFAMETEDLDELVSSRQIARYELTARQAIIYLRSLEAGKGLRLRYRLRATMPVKVTVPPGQAYEYYDPQRRSESKASQLIAREA